MTLLWLTEAEYLVAQVGLTFSVESRLALSCWNGMFISTLGLEHAAQTDFYSSVVLAVPLVMSVNMEHLPHGLCEVTLFPVEVSKYFREIFWGGQMYWFLVFGSVRAHMLIRGSVSRQRSEGALDFLELEMQACTGLLCRCWDLSSGLHCSASTLAAEPLLQSWIPCSLFSCYPLL